MASDDDTKALSLGERVTDLAFAEAKRHSLLALILGKIVTQWNVLRKTRHRIAITGAAGVGKTVIADFLNGKARKRGYKPGAATTALTRTIVAANDQALEDVPGHAYFGTREQALRDVFHADQPLTCVMHVVANGYLSPERLSRENLAAIRADELETIEDYQARMREDELKDFLEVRGYILDHLAIHREHFKRERALQLLPVLAKRDLYVEALADVDARYTSWHSDDPFARALAALIADSKRTTPLKLCPSVDVAMWPEALEWNGHTRPPRVEDLRTEGLESLHRLLAALEDMSK